MAVLWQGHPMTESDYLFAKGQYEDMKGLLKTGSQNPEIKGKTQAVVDQFEALIRAYEDEHAFEIAMEKSKQDMKKEKEQQWTAQGLCRYCGGSLGMFKKCKSCGTKN